MSADFAAQRAAMVEGQVRVADVTDYAIQDAMRLVPREACLPADKAYLAYADTDVAYAPGRWLLRPRDVAKLLQGLKPRAGEKALAIAAPYAAAVLAAMGCEVTTQADPTATPTGGNYDLAVCEGVVSAVPAAWTGALKTPGGRLGVVVRAAAVGRAQVLIATDTGFGARDLFDCQAPIMAGFEPAQTFAF